MLRVERVGERFSVEVSPPHSDRQWSSTEPLDAADVLAVLGRRGCHSTDICDALDATGVDWRPLHDAEVMRRRGNA